jgi:hypothetical protein
MLPFTIKAKEKFEELMFPTIRINYQTSHLLTGFMLEPSLQLKSREKSKKQE